MVDLRVESSLRLQLPDPQKNGSLQTTERHIVVVVVALVLTCLVEFSQLIDARWLNGIRKTWLGASLLGIGFKWSDLPYYAIGAIAGWGLARLLGAGPPA